MKKLILTILLFIAFISKISAQDTTYIKVPKEFSPNGDRKDDSLKIQYSKKITSIIITISDKKNVILYEGNTTKKEISWDGKDLTGKEVPKGAYLYNIKAKKMDNMDYLEKGFIRLIR